VTTMTSHVWAWTNDQILATSLDVTKSRFATWTDAVFCTQCGLTKKIRTSLDGDAELAESALPVCIATDGPWQDAVPAGVAHLIPPEESR